MARLVETQEIDAPVEKVFPYMTDPNKLVDWVTFLTHVHVTSEKIIGTETCVTCSMIVLGKKIVFDGITSDYKEGELYAWKSQKHSSFSMKSRLEFSKKQWKTQVKWTLEYTMGVPLLGKIAEPIFLNYFRHEMQRSLERVQKEFRQFARR